MDQEFHGDQDNVAEVISRYTIHDEPLGFDGEYPAKWLLSLREFGAASDYVLGDRALNLQRAHKDAEEMELLREASRMNDRVMTRVRGVFHDGITEKEAAGIISRMFVEEGADMPGWVIVAFGPKLPMCIISPAMPASRKGTPFSLIWDRPGRAIIRI